MHDDLAKLQARLLGGAFAQERHRNATSEEALIKDSAKQRRIAKRSKLPPRPKLEPMYVMAPIKKPKGFKREFKSLVERTNEAAAKERGG